MYLSLENILGVRSMNDPGKYLGLPVIVGKNKKRAFQSIMDRVLERSWLNRCLSHGGKAIFVKSILQAM